MRKTPAKKLGKTLNRVFVSFPDFPNISVAEIVQKFFEILTNQNRFISIFRSKVVPKNSVYNFYMKMFLFFQTLKLMNIAYSNSLHVKKKFFEKKFQ